MNDAAIWMLLLVICGPLIAGTIFVVDRWMYRRWWESQLDDEPAVPPHTDTTV